MKLGQIPTIKLHPHPDNPRKDLGDLSELAESIKVSGVLQNLTVVPNMAIGEVTGEAWQRGYKVIIGHRRLAAAKLAGLESLPCIVADMTEQEQIRTMLVENMQRSDLTVFEQAKGFQMMLDMGEDVDSIARQSGFSASTVRRRVKLLELDDKAFKKAQDRGGTLFDFMELDKIEHPDLKNEVLASIGTANFQAKLKTAIDREKLELYLEDVIGVLETFAVKIEDRDFNTMQYVKQYGRCTLGADVEAPEDATSARYYFRVGNDQVDLYINREDIPADEEAERIVAERVEKKARHDAHRAELEAISERHATLRKEFLRIVGKTKIKASLSGIASAIIYASVSGTAYDRTIINGELLAYLAEIEFDEKTENEAFAEDCEVKCNEAPERTLLATAYAMLENKRYAYWGDTWMPELREYRCNHKENPRLDRCYEFLYLFGYEMSDEEEAMQDGSHDLFREGLS